MRHNEQFDALTIFYSNPGPGLTTTCGECKYCHSEFPIEDFTSATLHPRDEAPFVTFAPGNSNGGKHYDRRPRLEDNYQVMPSIGLSVWQRLSDVISARSPGHYKKANWEVNKLGQV